MSASVNKLLGEMNADGLTDDTALKLRSALFLHKSLNDEDVLPAKDNALLSLVSDSFNFGLRRVSGLAGLSWGCGLTWGCG